MQSKGMYTGHLAMLGANLLWGVMSPLSKAVLQSGLVGPLSLTTLRMVGAAAAFWILSLFTKALHLIFFPPDTAHCFMHIINHTPKYSKQFIKQIPSFPCQRYCA